jgi:ABC-type nickel/cobalt efflux system permease component RcnA
MILIIGLIIGMILTVMVYSMYILVGAFILWMAIDAGKQDRFWWLVVIIGIPIIGATVYYFTEKKHEYAKAPVHHIHQSETEHQHEHAPHKHASGSQENV